jgi:glycosyltransferase involved in cell wall biosynthesis
MGHEVSILTRYYENNIFPSHQRTSNIYKYVNSSNVDVYILPDNKNIFTKIPFLSRLIHHTKGLYSLLEKLSPDVIFCHGIFISDYDIIIKYKDTHSKVKIYIDNHSDYYNTPVKKGILHYIYRHFYQIPLLKRLEKRTEVFWGVTPWRVDYMRDVFHLGIDKTDLLVMGGEDEKIHFSNKEEIKIEIRKKYGISTEDFLVVSGGKIDLTKNIHLLVDAVERLPNVKLLIFGNIDLEVEPIIKNKLSTNIIYAGWVNSTDVYDIFLAADLAVFPGTHSVLWEQACACGIPCIFKDWDKHMNHVDLGGNCLLLTDVTIDSIKAALLYIVNNKFIYNDMKNKAESKAIHYFSYNRIAKQAIQEE